MKKPRQQNKFHRVQAAHTWRYYQQLENVTPQAARRFDCAILLTRNFRAPLAFCLCAALVVTSCVRQQYLDEDESALGTNSASATLDHIAAYYPSGISLNFHGFVVGIEESPSQWISYPEDLNLFEDPASGDKVKFLLNKVRVEHLQFVSQVYNYQGRPYGEGNCALYNLYRDDDGGLMPLCQDARYFPVNQNRDYRKVFKNSWAALDVLRNQLEADIASGDYTHLLVLMMGLNTPQEESIRNFNSIVWSIRRASGAKFKPLVIGITWPSFATSRWFSPVWDTLSYVPKSYDADKLGLTWVGVLIQDVIGPLSKSITTVAISHSFGARALSMATCIGPAIRREGAIHPLNNDRVIDYFIGLEAAFSLERFNDDVYPIYEDIYYPDACSRAGKMILTVSKHDAASPNAFWADHAGNYSFYRSFCESEKEFEVTCVQSDSRGRIGETHARSGRLIYIDTSDIMRFDVPGTNWAGHSDIFRPPTGRLIWRLIADKP